MIQATITRNAAGLITAFKLTGHADSGAYGQDIVCAAVSVLAINTVNSAEKIAHVQPVVQSDEANGGLLIAEFQHSKQVADPILQAILASFALGMYDVAASYHDYVNLQETTH